MSHLQKDEEPDVFDESALLTAMESDYYFSLMSSLNSLIVSAIFTASAIKLF